MDENLRKAWTEIIDGKELDGHLNDLGQAEVNAHLSKRMLEKVAIPKNGKLLVHGCGTGQILDFIPLQTFSKYNTTFADINREYLKMLNNRLKAKNCSNIKSIIDDAENSSLNEDFHGILSVLLLEQIDWKKGIDNKIKLNPENIYLIIQEQNSSVNTITVSLKSRKSIKKFSEMAKPVLVPRGELTDYLESFGYKLVDTEEVDVPNSKKMVGLIYRRSTQN